MAIEDFPQRLAHALRFARACNAAISPLRGSRPASSRRSHRHDHPSRATGHRASLARPLLAADELNTAINIAVTAHRFNVLTEENLQRVALGRSEFPRIKREIDLIAGESVRKTASDLDEHLGIRSIQFAWRRLRSRT
jgi:hypothetical protein